MTIVCATHFTDSSFAALKVAAGLARRTQQALWLVSVVPHQASDAPGPAAVSDSLLIEAASLSNEGLDTQTAVLQGAVDQALAKFCTEKKAQLLVVGDSDHDTSRLFAGTLDSFAEAIDLPLLVVRDFKPFQAWTHRQAPLRVMLALDHSQTSAVARDWISRLAVYGPLDLVAAHIWWPATEYARRGLPVPPIAEAHMALSKVLRHETEATLQSLPANVKHRVHLEIGAGDVGEQLLALAASEQAHLLVLGTNHHRPLGLWRSVSHLALISAPMSVACVPGATVMPGLEPAVPMHPEAGAAHPAT